MNEGAACNVISFLILTELQTTVQVVGGQTIRSISSIWGDDKVIY